MIIREMEPQELDVVLNIFNYYCEEAEVDQEKFDPDRLLRTVKEYCIRPNLCFRVAFNGLRPIGLIGGFLSEDPIEREVAATIQFNYLLPEYATTENYQQLVEEFRRWADQFSVEQIRAIDIGRKITRLHTVYDQLGFDPIRLNIMNKAVA